MTKKKLLLLFVVIYSFAEAKAQMTIYSFNELYQIDLPAKLELQLSELNNTMRTNEQGKRTKVNITTQSDHIVFQQKGLNDDVKEAFNKYCRVIIEYFKEDWDDPTFGRGDAIVIDKDILNAVTDFAKESCTKSKTPFIKLISVQSLTINGFPVLYYSYKRKGWEGKQPPVIVNVYRIFNKYESVTLTFSYREAERGMWRSIHNDITKTFSFIKKY